MRKIALLLLLILLLNMLPGCNSQQNVQVVATTGPVYEFTAFLCQGTDIGVSLLITESVSCLHDYTLQVSQMRMLERAELLVMNGAGLEIFIEDASPTCPVIDCSEDILLLDAGGCQHSDEHHDHSHGHSHEHDAHIWLSPDNAKQMASTICRGLSAAYPQHADTITENLTALTSQLDDLKQYGIATLASLSCRELITFHDGFSYFADAFGLTILKAVEEESGSEASASDLKELAQLITDHDLPAIFTETNGSTAAAQILSAETDVPVYTLDMAMSGKSYFEAMHNNIDTIKEALG